MVHTPVYMDNHATTRVDPRVVEAMVPCFSDCFGNAGSVSHVFGWQAKDAVDAARETIAEAIGGRRREIIFTSGATESNNLAIRGVAERRRRRGNHLVSVETEHPAVLDPLDRLGRHGFDVTLLPVQRQTGRRPGWLDPQRVAEAIRDDTLLVSVMLANNEIGVIQDVAEIGRICRDRGVPLHCDATQAVGKIAIDVDLLHVDLMSFSAHKMYGPKGIACLYLRRREPTVRLQPQIDGGGQEGGLRSGTLNVPGIVGMATAVAISLAELPTESPRLRALRDRLADRLAREVPDSQLNGPPLSPPDWRLPGNLNVSFGDVDGEALMMSMKDLAVSSGSACTSVDPEPSHVLRALGLSEERTRSSLRFGLGRFNTEDEVDFAVDTVSEAVKRLRNVSSVK